MTTQITRFYIVKRIGEEVNSTFLTAQAARDEARLKASNEDGQFGVFEVIDCYQSGQPPVHQITIKR